jgi:hypothetical protein
MKILISRLVIASFALLLSLAYSSCHPGAEPGDYNELGTLAADPAPTKARRQLLLDKLKEKFKPRVDLRKVDKTIAPAETDTACEKDIYDPKYAECRTIKKESECKDSKVCRWDSSRTKHGFPDPVCVSAQQDECVGIDLGCCEGEKRMAVNKKSVAALVKTRDEACDAFTKLPENRGLCRNRRFYHHEDEKPQCINKKCELH